MKKLLTSVFLVFMFCSVVYAATQRVEVIPINDGIKSSTTTATTTAGKCPATALVGRKSMIIHNTSAVTVYIGASDVSSSNGYELEEDDAISIDISDNIDVYVRTASSTADVRTLEIK